MGFDDDYDHRLRERGGNSLAAHLSGILRALIALAFVAIVIGLFWPEWQRQREITRNNHELEERIVREEKLLAARTRELDWLRNDPEYLELLARDRLNLQRKGETIFRIELPERVQTVMPR